LCADCADSRNPLFNGIMKHSIKSANEAHYFLGAKLATARKRHFAVLSRDKKTFFPRVMRHFAAEDNPENPL